MLHPSQSPMVGALGAIAPGRPLREGLDRVLQADMGALVVCGDGPEVLQICSGGFLVDSSFSPQRMSELAKMDGAIILAADATRIARANVHLVPDPSTPTAETGTRHRTAERVARSIDVPVIAVSEDMSIITLYLGTHKHVLASVPRLQGRANQALQTLERYRDRLDAVTSSLSALEVEDLVTVRDVATVLQRAEMVRRIAGEVAGYIVELGTDGRLIRLQADEMLAGVTDDRRTVILDYLASPTIQAADDGVRAIELLETDRLLDTGAVAEVTGLSGGPDGPLELESSVAPRGYRLLGKIPRLPEHVVAAIAERFGTLQKVMRATVEELLEVDGVGQVMAVTVKDGLAHLAESTILDRYS